jgi:hypothetical protein
MSASGDSRPPMIERGHGRAVYLLGLLLLMFVAVPVMQSITEFDDSDWLRDNPDEPLRSHLLELFVDVVLVVAAVTVAQTKRWWIVVGVLIGPPLVVRAIERSGTDIGEPMQAAVGIYVGLALLYVVWQGLKRFFERSKVTVDTIATAICAYILMGLAFMYLFASAETVSPDAFGRDTKETADLFYFSFVTLTTLGYGDLTPKLGTVRSLAIVEAIIGQMYVAVVLARLVSMYISPSEKKDA